MYLFLSIIYRQREGLWQIEYLTGKNDCHVPKGSLELYPITLGLRGGFEGCRMAARIFSKLSDGCCVRCTLKQRRTLSRLRAWEAGPGIPPRRQLPLGTVLLVLTDVNIDIARACGGRSRARHSPRGTCLGASEKGQLARGVRLSARMHRNPA